MKLMKKACALIATITIMLGTLSTVSAARFDTAIQDATQPIQQHLEGAGFAGAQGGAEGVRDTIIVLLQKVIVPGIIIVGVLMCII